MPQNDTTPDPDAAAPLTSRTIATLKALCTTEEQKQALFVLSAALSRTPDAEFRRGIEAAMEAVKNIPPCPFDRRDHGLKPTDPCPTCGDLGTFDQDDGTPIRCQSVYAAIRALSGAPATPEVAGDHVQGILAIDTARDKAISDIFDILHMTAVGNEWNTLRIKAAMEEWERRNG
jgi:hypothetical protein